MSSATTSKPLDVDSVMRSIRPQISAPERLATEPVAAPRPTAEPSRDTIPTSASAPSAPAVTPKRTRRAEARVQVDVQPAVGEATVGVYLRLPKSLHQQLKTVVFKNEMTEQGHQSIADIAREAIAHWLEGQQQAA